MAESTDDASQAPSLPPLFARVLQVVVSPGDLFQALRHRPVWGGALFLSAILVGLSMAFFPQEMWVEMTRTQMMERGQEVPAGLENTGMIMMIGSVVGALVMTFVMAFIMAGLVTLFFSFILGDQVGYRHYLAVVSHGFIISALGALLLFPLRLSQGNPTMILSVGSLLPFLQEGYALRVLNLLDLFALWAYGVMAVGVSKMDPRRSFGSALLFFLGFALAMALIFGSFGG